MVLNEWETKFPKANKDKESGILIKGVRWTPALREKIATSDEAVKHALLRIYSFQTENEQQSEETTEANGKGFNALDAELMTSFAKQLETRKFLSPKQMKLARKKLMKYSMQLFGFIVEPLFTSINTDPNTGKFSSKRHPLKDLYDLLRYTDYQEKLCQLAKAGELEYEQIKDFVAPEIFHKYRGAMHGKTFGI